MDSDVEIKKDALTVINKHFNKKIILDWCKEYIPTNQIMTVAISIYSYYSYYLFTETKKNKFTNLCTNFLAIKKSIFMENKGFDHHFNSATAEDQEFGFRLLKRFQDTY